jgi:hypothetical protein
MAHRSHEPARLQSRKKRLPRDRGEKYLAPDAGVDGKLAAAPPGARGRSRKGQAHELVRKAPPGSLRYPVQGERSIRGRRAGPI